MGDPRSTQNHLDSLRRQMGTNELLLVTKIEILMEFRWSREVCFWFLYWSPNQNYWLKNKCTSLKFQAMFYLGTLLRATIWETGSQRVLRNSSREVRKDSRYLEVFTRGRGGTVVETLQTHWKTARENKNTQQSRHTGKKTFSFYFQVWQPGELERLAMNKHNQIFLFVHI